MGDASVKVEKEIVVTLEDKLFDETEDKDENLVPELDNGCDIYVARLGEAASKFAFVMSANLRSAGISAETDICGRSLKAQMKYADKIKAKYSVVLGDNEIEAGKAELKNMKTGEKKKISIGEDFVDSFLTESTAQDDLAF